MVNVVLIATAAMGLHARSKIAQRAVACPANPICPANDGCIVTDPTNAATFQVSCNVDFYGSDFQTAQTSGYTNCLHACSVTNTCIAVSWANGFCYLKNKVPQAIPNAKVTGAALTGVAKATATPVPSNYCSLQVDNACPSNTNCIFNGGRVNSLKPFILECNQDFYGGDFLSYYAASMSSCAGVCTAFPACVAVSWMKSTNTCWLKNTINPSVYSPNITGAYLKPGGFNS